jgi:TRAP-type C4-dicarboxylate transport system substrate-binding protein
MKKTLSISLVFFFIAGLFCGYIAGTDAVQASQDKPAELTFSIADSPNHPDIKRGFSVWAKEVEKRTGGKVKITIHAGQTLAKASEQYDMVLKGGADITKVVGTHYRGRFPLLDIYSLPFLMPHGAKDKSGNLVRDLVMEKYIIPAYFKDMKVLFTGRYQPNVIHLVKKPVRKLEDMKGMVISVPGGKTNIDMVKALGGSPETVKTPDVYTALERGMVEGHVLPLSTQRSFKFYEVTKYVTIANFGSAATVLVLRKETWNRLSPDVQKVVDELSPWGAALLDKVGRQNAESAAKLVTEKGLEIIELSPQERARWAEATSGIEKDWAAKADAKKLPGSEMLQFVKQTTSE